jgi:hypothetical protein
MRQRRLSPVLIVLVVVPVVAVVVAVVAVLKFAGGGGAPVSTATHAAGATVKDSWFTFRVADVRTRKAVTGVGGDATAKGTFVLVSLDVTNHDDKPWTVFADDQMLRAAGQSYGIDERATADVDQGSQMGLPGSLNPGEKRQIIVAYDVPAGTVPQAIELHGAPKSHGVTVALPAR